MEKPNPVMPIPENPNPKAFKGFKPLEIKVLKPLSFKDIFDKMDRKR